MSVMPVSEESSSITTSGGHSHIGEMARSVRRWVLTCLDRPLNWYEALGSLLALMVLGTAYCQLYCLLAFQQMHGLSMSLVASIARAGSDVVPAFLTFELGKRILQLPSRWRWPALVALFCAGLAVGLFIRLQAHPMTWGVTSRRMAVDRLPFLLLAGVALAYYELRRRAAAMQGGGQADSEAPGGLPPPQLIEWVRAAGNYVELRVAGRTRLVRMTLRGIGSLLPDDLFVQIHRSVIVNRQKIVSVRGRHSVEMSDGTSFNVGDAHRRNLPQR